MLIFSSEILLLLVLFNLLRRKSNFTRPIVAGMRFGDRDDQRPNEINNVYMCNDNRFFSAALFVGPSARLSVAVNCVERIGTSECRHRPASVHPFAVRNTTQIEY